MNWKEFWEFYKVVKASSQQKVVVEMMLVDLVDDLNAGILLSQIVYWYTPGNKGNLKLRLIKDADYWIAKTYSDWWQEIRLKKKQLMRAASILSSKGFITTKVFKYAGSPTLHYKLNLEFFVKALQDKFQQISDSAERALLKVPKGHFQTFPLGTIESAERALSSITEITSEITTEKESLSLPSGSPFFTTINEIWQTETGTAILITKNFQKTWKDITKICSEIEIESAVRAFLDHPWRKANPATRVSSVLFKDADSFRRWIEIYKMTKNNVKNKKVEAEEEIKPKTKQKFEFEEDIQYFIQTNTWQNFIKEHKAGYLVGVGLLKENEKNNKAKIDEAEKKAIELYTLKKAKAGV